MRHPAPTPDANDECQTEDQRCSPWIRGDLALDDGGYASIPRPWIEGSTILQTPATLRSLYPDLPAYVLTADYTTPAGIPLGAMLHADATEAGARAFAEARGLAPVTIVIPEDPRQEGPAG